MKALYGALVAFALAAPASAQSADPKLDFLGYCVASGNSSNYCACLTDTIATKVSDKDLSIYLDYLKLIASGQRDERSIISTLKKNHDVTGKELGAALTTASTAATEAEKTCAGL